MEKEPAYSIGKDKDYFEKGKEAYFIKDSFGTAHFKEVQDFNCKLAKIVDKRIKFEGFNKNELEILKALDLIFCNHCGLNVINGERYSNSSYITEHGSLNEKEKIICDENGFLSALF